MDEIQKAKFEPANRIASFKPYFFAALNEKLNRMKSEGKEIIRIDMGSPDMPPADFIVDALVEEARKPGVHGYTANAGTPEFRKAVVQYYGKRFGVELDSQKEVIGLLGSKEGLFNLSQVILNPGDVVLVPDPGYPVYTGGALIAGAEIYHMPLLEENHFLPDLKSIPPRIAARAKLMWLNYPNNPTGAIATREFFMEAVDFARQYGLLLAHDAPYTDVCFDGYHAPSILEIPGAMDVCVEFNSLSKTYNMAGWRLGMVAGNPNVIRYLSTYKSQVDSSHFQPMLAAGIRAMTGDQSWLEARNAIYQQRRDMVLAAMRESGLYAPTPPAAIYVWVRLPKGQSSIEFCNRLLEETGVSTTPGIVYGEYGEGYLRISLGSPTEKIRIAMERFKGWMKN